jgi:hypothetical protein
MNIEDYIGKRVIFPKKTLDYTTKEMKLVTDVGEAVGGRVSDKDHRAPELIYIRNSKGRYFACLPGMIYLETEDLKPEYVKYTEEFVHPWKPEKTLATYDWFGTRFPFTMESDDTNNKQSGRVYRA